MRIEGFAYRTWAGALAPVYVYDMKIYIGDPYGGADLLLEDAPDGELVAEWRVGTPYAETDETTVLQYAIDRCAPGFRSSLKIDMLKFLPLPIVATGMMVHYALSGDPGRFFMSALLKLGILTTITLREMEREERYRWQEFLEKMEDSE